MNRAAAELQVRFVHLSAYPEVVLEGMVSVKNAWLFSDEERAIAAMELCYRWSGEDDLLPEMIWQLIFRHQRPYPIALVSPSQHMNDSWAMVRKAWGASYAAACQRLSPPITRKAASKPRQSQLLARHDAGLTQRELAKVLRRAHSFVGKIESGERQLNILEFCEYADALGSSAPDLLRRVLAVR